MFLLSDLLYHQCWTVYTLLAGKSHLPLFSVLFLVLNQSIYRRDFLSWFIYLWWKFVKLFAQVYFNLGFIPFNFMDWFELVWLLLHMTKSCLRLGSANSGLLLWIIGVKISGKVGRVHGLEIVTTRIHLWTSLPLIVYRFLTLFH